jgi:hypothetical protein
MILSSIVSFLVHRQRSATKGLDHLVQSLSQSIVWCERADWCTPRTFVSQPSDTDTFSVVFYARTSEFRRG